MPQVAQLYVKGAVNEQIVPREWLYTQPSADLVNYGLEGRYYLDDGKHDIEAAKKDPSRLMLARQDTKMNLRFGADGPAPGMQGDKYMARWTGYITAPTAGTYNLGAYADDGIRIKTGTGLFGAMETKVDRWTEQATTTWSGDVKLEANKPTPIVVDWFEQGGNAELKLIMRGNGYADYSIFEPPMQVSVQDFFARQLTVGKVDICPPVLPAIVINCTYVGVTVARPTAKTIRPEHAVIHFILTAKRGVKTHRES